jgi:hypothetical protein
LVNITISNVCGEDFRIAQDEVRKGNSKKYSKELQNR